MTERWINFFEEDSKRYSSRLEYAINHWRYNDPLYFRIKKLLKPPAKLLDIGCGLGFSDIYLQECGYKVTGIDNVPEIVEKARMNAKYFGSSVNFEQGETFNLSKHYDKFDLVYSVGVLEHFDRKTTIALLKEQTKCARYVMIVVPTKYTKYSGTITDERIYTISQLSKMVEEAGMVSIDRFGYGNVFSPMHNWIHRVLPHGVYRILQNRFSYAMGIGCIGAKYEK